MASEEAPIAMGHGMGGGTGLSERRGNGLEPLEPAGMLQPLGSTRLPGKRDFSMSRIPSGMATSAMDATQPEFPKKRGEYSTPGHQPSLPDPVALLRQTHPKPQIPLFLFLSLSPSPSLPSSLPPSLPPLFPLSPPP